MEDGGVDLPRISQSCRKVWRHGALQDDAIIKIIKPVPRWTEAWSSRDDTTDVYLIKTDPVTRSP